MHSNKRYIEGIIMYKLKDESFRTRAKFAKDALYNCVQKAYAAGIINQFTEMSLDTDVDGIDAQIQFQGHWADALGPNKLQVQIKNRINNGDDAEIELVHDQLGFSFITYQLGQNQQRRELNKIYSREEFVADKSLKPSVGRDLDGIRKKKFDCFLWFDRAQNNAYLFKIDTLADYISKFETAVEQYLLGFEHLKNLNKPNENKFQLAKNLNINLNYYELENFMIKITNNVLLYIPYKLADLHCTI